MIAITRVHLQTNRVLGIQLTDRLIQRSNQSRQPTGGYEVAQSSFHRKRRQPNRNETRGAIRNPIVLERNLFAGIEGLALVAVSNTRTAPIDLWLLKIPDAPKSLELLDSTTQYRRHA